MPVFYALMLLVFTITLFVSASLLFLIQPMVGKMILPFMGGTPAVWNTCMVFFQGMLLLGYTFAHLTTRWLGVRLQALVQLGLILLPALVLPITANRELAPQGQDYPVFGILRLLFMTAGIPFFVVATTAPLLQKWFASTGHPAAKDPYFLYGASNLGSLLALVAYPLLMERYQGLPGQAWIWSFGYFMMAMLIAMCAAFLWMSPKQPAVGGSSFRAREQGPYDMEERPSAWRRARWVALAFVPSSLMLAVTTFITTDIAAVPFIWVVPLGIYLISFILVFSRLPALIHWIMVGLLPLVVLALIFIMLSDLKPVIWWQIALHLFVLFVVSMVCHGELARDRPPTEYLTGFYLLMSLGGVLGGMFNTLLAPLIFVSIKEYDLALVFACFLIPRLGPRQRTKFGLIYDLAWVWIIGTLAAWLVTLAIRNNQVPDYHQLLTPVATLGTRLCVASLLFLIASYLLLGRKDLLNRVFDVVPPLLLAVLVFGILWGAQIAKTKNAWLDRLLVFETGYDNLTYPSNFSKSVMFGLPILFCLVFLRRPVQFGLGVAALLLVGGLYNASRDRSTIFQERSFYGVMKVDTTRDGNYHWLIHGNINHGVQRMDNWRQIGRELFLLAPPRPEEAALSTLVRNQIWTEKHYPVAYFHPKTPYGQLFLSFKGKYAKKHIAIIGLGTGGLSGYAYKGQKWRYFELDPAVERLARNKELFTYLSDCDERGVDLKVILGDARLQLEKIDFDKPEDKYDVIAFDAFTSDAIPIHLVTQNALDTYLSKLMDHGIVVFHISNRYVDLEPVIARLGQERGLAGLIQNDPGDENDWHYGTSVIILARSMEAFGDLAKDSRWKKLKTPKDTPLWTDDYSNLLRYLKWRDKEKPDEADD